MSLVFLAGCDPKTREALGEVKPTPPEAGPSLLTEKALKKGLAALRRRVGESPLVLKLVVFPNRIVLQARNGENAEHIDQHVYRRDGTLGEPVPVKLKGPGKLEDNLFPLRDAKLDAIPKLVDEAIAASGVEDGKVGRVVLKRDLPKKVDIEFQVHISGPRKDAVLQADAEGNLIASDDK